MQTYIPGKDAPLEETIHRFQQQLKTLGFHIEEVSWLNPVPNVWSVHIRDRDCALCFTNGKGATKKAALASALGEYFERLSTNYFFSDFYLGKTIANSDFVHYPNEKWFAIPQNNSLPKGLLTARLRQFYDPDHQLTASMLIDLQSSAVKRGICALPFIEQSSQKTVFFPVNIISNLYVSNGMAAGNNQNEARVQALSEILERYVKNKIITEAISLPIIPQAVIKHYTYVTTATNKLQQQGFPVYYYDASLGGKYPVICVVLFNPKNGGCFASFGAHPDFGVALERTVTELLQGRSLNDLDVFMPPTFDNNLVADETNLETHFIDSSGLISWDLFNEVSDYPFVNWQFSGTTETELATLLAIFKQHDIEIYIMDYQHLGVYTCRILAVGMSEIYPVEDLLLNNNNMAIQWRKTLLTLPDNQLSQDEYLELIIQLDETGFDDAVRVRELLGIATGNNNAWYTLRIGELKSMLALAGGDWEQAFDWVEWTKEFNASLFTDEQKNYYRCLSTLLDFALTRRFEHFSDYQTAFEKMYGKQTVETVYQVIQGNIRFYGLFTIDDSFNQLLAHQHLLQAYQKLQQAKSTLTLYDKTNNKERMG